MRTNNTPYIIGENSKRKYIKKTRFKSYDSIIKIKPFMNKEQNRVAEKSKKYNAPIFNDLLTKSSRRYKLIIETHQELKQKKKILKIRNLNYAKHILIFHQLFQTKF